MKKIIQLLSVACVALVFGSLTAFAQSGNLIKSTIPFDFTVGNKMLEKGSYELRVTDYTSGGAVVTFVDSKGNRIESLAGSVTTTQKFEKAELVFKLDGERRVLTEIATPAYAVDFPFGKNGTPATAAGPGPAVSDVPLGSN